MITLEPRYIAPAQNDANEADGCLQMILRRNNQGDRRFALCIDKGLNVVGSSGLLNALFREAALDLCAQGVKRSDIPSMNNFVMDALQQGHDFWVVYDNNGIHHGLIEGFDVPKGMVSIVGPAPSRPPERVSLSYLKSIVSKDGEDKTGFVIVSKTAFCP